MYSGKSRELDELELAKFLALVSEVYMDFNCQSEIHTYTEF